MSIVEEAVKSGLMPNPKDLEVNSSSGRASSTRPRTCT